MTAAIQFTDVVKRYGATEALAGLTLDVQRGEMFGLIGADGAGKTTAIRVMCGLLHADAGEVRVLGRDPVREHRAVTDKVGYLSQRFSLYGDLSIDENIAFFAEIHGVRGYQRRRDQLLEMTQLTPFRARLADRLSGGMKQKLALACTLVHEPELIMLDEPTTGVDPVSRREFWKLLSEFLANGITILMSTPYLDEAERCSRVALLHEGRLLASDEPARLRASIPGKLVEVMGERAPRLVDVVRRIPGVIDAQVFGERLHVTLADTRRRGGGALHPGAPGHAAAGRVGEARRAITRGCLHRTAGDAGCAIMRHIARIVLCGLTLSATAAAQEPALRITLEEAQARADQTSHRLAEARAREAAARAAIDARAAADQPLVSASAGYTRTSHVPEFVVPGPGGAPSVLYPDVPDNYRTRLDLQWPIYNGGRTRRARARRTGRGVGVGRRRGGGEGRSAPRSRARVLGTRHRAGDGACPRTRRRARAGERQGRARAPERRSRFRQTRSHPPRRRSRGSGCSSSRPATSATCRPQSWRGSPVSTSSARRSTRPRIWRRRCRQEPPMRGRW